MKIFVVGSSRHLTSEQELAERFRKFCQSLGELFARKRCTVLIGSLDKGTADHWLLKGMCREADNNRATHAHIYRNEGLTEEELAEFRLEPHTKFQNMAVAHISAISAADVVIAVGGGPKTRAAVLAALALEKPIVLVKQFNGVAGELWKDLYLMMYPYALSNESYNTLSDANCTTDALCKGVVLACEQLITKARQKAFTSWEILRYSVLAFGLAVTAACLATLAPLAGWIAAIITVSSVTAGWLLAQLIAGEKKGLMVTFPHAMMLSLVILVAVALGDTMLRGIIDDQKAVANRDHLYFLLIGTGLLAGYSVQTALPIWLKRLGQKLNEESSNEYHQ